MVWTKWETLMEILIDHVDVDILASSFATTTTTTRRSE